MIRRQAVCRLMSRPWVSVAAPLLLYVLHASVFGAWIVDDAGISFAYSRNLASLNGLVPQPGAERVEGYSNPAWVFLLAVAFALHLFHPVATPKVIGLVLVAGTFVLLRKTMRTVVGVTDRLVLAALLLVSVNTSFVVWTISGLENALYAFTIVLLVYGTVKDLADEQVCLARAAWLGAAAAFVALTRPDGAAFFFGWPIAVMLARLRFMEGNSKNLPGRLMAYTACFLCLFGGYLTFRLLYFGDFVPNTAHAKARDMFAFTKSVIGRRARHVIAFVRSLGGIATFPILVATGLFVAHALLRRTLNTALAVLALFFAVSFGVFMVLPPDWMKEFRFATPVVTLVYALVIVVYQYSGLRAIVWERAWPGWRTTVLVGLLMISLAGFFGQRSLAFAKAPTISFAEVRDKWGVTYNQLVKEYGIENASVLLPDMGGTLYYSELRVYDLAMLCDKTIAKTLGGKGWDSLSAAVRRTFYDYVFATIKPTFIRSHGIWTDKTRLWEDPRLERDYYLLYKKEVPPTQWLGPWHVLDYVRKDAVADLDSFRKRYLEVMWYLEPVSSGAQSHLLPRGLCHEQSLSQVGREAAWIGPRSCT